ncbi:MAG: XrtA system polysaccharide chain length determinant [Betaproteobacteria bacterium]
MQEFIYKVVSSIAGAWRYRWYAVGVAWLAAIGGWSAVFLTPDRYEAYARVYVDTQSVLRPLLSGVAVQPNVDQLVTMMSRTLISRPNLEKVIRMADMDIKLKTPEDREELITRLGKQLEIKSAGRENFYTIAYSHRNPQEAKRVVQALLTIFVEGSLGDKRRDSDSARRFIDEQLKAYADKLVTAENAVTEFKQKHAGLMPGQGQNFYTRIGEAQAALNHARLELKEAETARDAFKRQITAQPPPSLLEESPGAADESASPELDARIQSLQQKLDALRLNYTERHPDIVSMSRMIEQLKEQKAKEAKPRKPAAPPVARSNPLAQQLSVSLAEAEANVASLQARVAEYERRYNELRSAINAIPRIEAEFTQLTRDYEVNKSNYEKLLARRESAQISGDMENKASVVDFRIIDPPVVPPKPSWPNRPMLYSLVLLAALAGGGAFAFLLSQLRPTLTDERRLHQVSGLAVFGSVVMALSEAQLRRRKRGFLAFLAALAALVSGYAAIMAAALLMARV